MDFLRSLFCKKTEPIKDISDKEQKLLENKDKNTVDVVKQNPINENEEIALLSEEANVDQEEAEAIKKTQEEAEAIKKAQEEAEEAKKAQEEAEEAKKASEEADEAKKAQEEENVN